MADYADRFADTQTSQLERQIAGTYAQAAREVREKMDDFWAAHRVKAERMMQDVQAGKITQQDYQDWLRNQVFTGNRWKQRLDEITQVYQNADKEARRMVNQTDREVFAESANYQAYKTEQATSGAVSFTMYDRATVDRMLKDDPKMLPEWKVNEKKDYTWNQSRVQNAVTQGIIQGESVGAIGKRLYRDLAASNANKMTMFARTAVTGAQNAGRVERMQEAQDMGIKVKKRWLAVHDNRTRDLHGDLDGKEVDVDQKFRTADGREIDYPGDPTADPDLVYNCRCTLIYVYPEYREQQHFEDHQTYQEWKDSKNEMQLERGAVGENGLQESDKNGTIVNVGRELRNNELPFTREERKRLVQTGVEQPKPVFSKDTSTNKFPSLASKAKPHPKYPDLVDIIAHGGEKTVDLFGKEIDGYLLADIMMSRHDHKKGQGFRLLSCKTGMTETTGDCVAQILANQTGEMVLAPMKDVYATTTGELIVDGYKNGEGWKEFYPRGKQ